jgi:glycosyltransferase involved in cell wall biosynthesis
MELKKQIELLVKSKHLHKNWYMEQYPDTAMLSMHPAEHYLRFGAMLGRNPGKHFDTQYYLQRYPDVAQSGLNPLIHYLLHGEAQGRDRRAPDNRKLNNAANKKISLIKRKYYTLGFTEQPLLELQDIIEQHDKGYLRGLAALELALKHLRLKTEADLGRALYYLQLAHESDDTKELIQRVYTAELLCHYFLGDIATGKKVYFKAKNAQLLNIDILLATANLETDIKDKLKRINQALDLAKVSRIFVDGASNLTSYDQLHAKAGKKRDGVQQLSKITVLLAAYNAEHTIPTTLRSLQEQSWQNFELIVIDDCSTDSTCAVVEDFAAKDNRIRLLRMQQNGGAYIARNAGLDIASGEFVTIHDADDWSHPEKLATQVQFLIDNPYVIGCTSEQARAKPDLEFSRLSGQGNLLIRNTSSFMFRRELVQEHLGYWDTVRFGADSEFIKRIQLVFGKQAVVHLATGPLSFQRDTEDSAVGDKFFGTVAGWFGARQEYFEAQLVAHKHQQLKYSNRPQQRPFAAPNPMIMPKAAAQAMKHFDVIIVSDFRLHGGSTLSNLEEIKAHKKAGLKTGLVQMYRYDFNANYDRVMLDAVREMVDGDLVQSVVYGENVSCDLLIVRYPPVLQYKQRFIPAITAKNIKVIINQPPMSDYTENGVVRYNLAQCAEHIRQYWGQDAVWYPIGPLVRDALFEHHTDELPNITLAEEYWSNIIDIAGWYRGKRTRKPSDTLRIGRHSRDHFVKWPGTKENVLAVYPEANDLEVHILGGADSPSELVGYTPQNWVVYPFGSMTPKDFLAEIDIFVYFAHPNWVEAFGRVMIEAMAVGVPVILPHIYQPLFKEAALYASEQQVVPLAKALHADPVRYQAQVQLALDYAKNNFSYEMHIARLVAYGVRRPVVADTNIPAQAGKTSLNKLAGVKRQFYKASSFNETNEVLFQFEDNGFQFDLFWRPKPGARRVFVFLSGDAMRSKNDPPVFQRWSWAEHVPGHCIYISDPSLYLDPALGLAWYAGTKEYDPLPKIAAVLTEIVAQLGLSLADIVAYGSSGGGFAALRLALFLDEITVVTINPQTDITRFETKGVEKYLRLCWHKISREQARAEHPERMSVVHAARAGKYQGRKIIYLQNTVDTHHVEDHFKPFCQAINVAPQTIRSETINIVLFEHEGGHGKAETPEAFAEAIRLISEN